jgi:IclR helix-turn-helix domain
VRETLAILRVIATRRATITDLTQAVRMSRASVYRLLTGCKRDLGMRIDCEARVFKLLDWGLLNRRKVLK